MSNTDQIRDIDQMNELVKVQLLLALDDIKQQGVTPLVVETLRTLERQKWLFGQGRTKAECKANGVPESYAREGAKVTSTLNSIHILGCAVDLIPQRGGKAIWDSDDKDSKKIIATMQQYGFESGANWQTFKDSPHYQVKGISSTANLYSASNNNIFVTKAMQAALNKKLKLSMKVDGVWGNKTTEAVDVFRVKSGYQKSGTIGTTVLKNLLERA